MNMVPVDLSQSKDKTGHWPFSCIAIAAGLAAAFIFVAFPEIDLAVSDRFYDPGSGFVFKTGIVPVLRKLLELIFTAICIATLIGLVALAFFNRKFKIFGLAVWVYLALCAAIGPGLVTNVVFKDNWGRARPHHVVEFGGTKQFTLPLVRSNQCDRNCSFFSGEAANYYMLGFAFAFLFGGRFGNRRKFFLGAIAAGSFVGLLRIGAGHHFLSDIVFAGIFNALIAQWLAWLVLERWGPQLEDGSRIHQAMLRKGAAVTAKSRRLYEWAQLRMRPRTDVKGESNYRPPAE